MKMKSRKQRKHGLERPFTNNQILTWILFVLNLVLQIAFIEKENIFYTLSLKVIHKIIIISIIIFEDLSLLILGLLTSLSDPSDMTLKY